MSILRRRKWFRVGICSHFFHIFTTSVSNRLQVAPLWIIKTLIENSQFSEEQEDIFSGNFGLQKLREAERRRVSNSVYQLYPHLWLALTHTCRAHLMPTSKSTEISDTVQETDFAAQPS